jgi:hypothetical protein
MYVQVAVSSRRKRFETGTLPSDHSEMLHGIRCALLVPAAMTVLSASLFGSGRRETATT